MRRRPFALPLALLGFALFAGIAQWRAQHPVPHITASVAGRVVIAAPVVLALYGGDRFLAANLETMRLSATAIDQGQADAGYLIRAQSVVAELNACHEDNYFLANGLLTWGGAVEEGNRVLRAALDCRFWDGVPAFFYGVNLAFFQRNIPEAQRVLEVGAQRWPENAAPLRKLAVMLQADTFADERLALNYLIQQRDTSADPALRQMLDKRVLRLQGLLTLREAQRRYEASHGPLRDLQQLVEQGVLGSLPVDPLRLGYELRDGRIVLKKLKIAGMEEQS